MYQDPNRTHRYYIHLWSYRSFTFTIILSSFCEELATYMESWDSSVDVATDYVLDGQGIGFRFPAGARNVPLLHGFQTVCGAHQASYPMGKGDLSPGNKAVGA
jgi:hypothetical protein